MRSSVSADNQRAFLGQVPFCIIAIVTVASVLKLPPVEHSGWRSQVRRVDFLGAAILIATITALLLGLDKGSNISWTAPVTVICLSLFAPLLILFVLVEVKYAAEPFAPSHIIFGKAVAPINVCGFFAFCAWYVFGLQPQIYSVTYNIGTLSYFSYPSFGKQLIRKTPRKRDSGSCRVSWQVSAVP